MTLELISIFCLQTEKREEIFSRLEEKLSKRPAER
jgi:hypothetical protein